jgi:hypothetical protein
MWCWLCRLWEFLAGNQSNYDPFSRNNASWWHSVQTRRHGKRRDEGEALEQIRDQWRR